MFGSALRYDKSAVFTAFGTEVDYVVRDFDDVKIVFDDKYRVPCIGEFLDYFNEFIHIRPMQPDRRFIKKV